MHLAPGELTRYPLTLALGLAIGLAGCGSSDGSGTNEGCGDADLDGVCDVADVCPGFDDGVDADGDGLPDGCDPCPADAEPDIDGDGICNSVDTETCDDLYDNDGDGASDCFDEDCATHITCDPPRYGALLGAVVDVSGAPLGNVRVKVGDSVAVTDAGGHFVLEGLLVGDDPSLVSFERSGYGSFARRVELRPDDTVYTRAVMKAASVFGWWQDPVLGFTVENPAAVRVTVPPDALLDSEGDPITDPVNVAIVTGDPTDPTEAPVMPGDYMSDESGGTPLDSIAFVDVTVTAVVGGAEVSRIDPTAPVVIELPIPPALQAAYSVDDTIPWWSFDETEGAWKREGVATVFDDGGTLWTRATVTHLSWWNVDNPVDTHGCICVDIVDGEEAPLEGMQVIARGVTYNGTSSPVVTDVDGRACVTVKNSADSAEQVDLFVLAGDVELPYAGNPVDTPTEAASCLRDIDCPEKCEVMPDAIILDRSGTVGGTVTLRSGDPAVDLLVGSDHGGSTTTDASGLYSLPVFIDIPFTVFTVGYTSPELLATEAQPDVTHDIALNNLPPQVVELLVNGVPQDVGSPDGRWLHVYVDDRTQPVEFAAAAIDGDGDPVAYAWSGMCYEYQPGGPGQEVPRECTPPDEPATTCEAPDVGSWPTQEGCQYTLSLDDGYVEEPLEWVISVAEGP